MSKRKLLCLAIGGLPVMASKELTKLISEAGNRGIAMKDYSYVSRYVREYGIFQAVLPVMQTEFSTTVTISKIEEI